jgi:hypothetical protein
MAAAFELIPLPPSLGKRRGFSGDDLNSDFLFSPKKLPLSS